MTPSESQALQKTTTANHMLGWKRFIFRHGANNAELQADQQCPLGCSPYRAEPQTSKFEVKKKWHTNT